jgi:hypothetical protein
MNSVLSDDLAPGLREIYERDDAARRLFDNFAKRHNDYRVTTVATAVRLTDTSESEIKSLFKELTELGVGKYMVSRRGSKSRIEWIYSMKNLGEYAQGKTFQLEPINNSLPDDSETGLSDELDADDNELPTHNYLLRTGLRIEFRLPADITAKEAERLALFIRSLPFDE